VFSDKIKEIHKQKNLIEKIYNLCKNSNRRDLKKIYERVLWAYHRIDLQKQDTQEILKNYKLEEIKKQTKILEELVKDFDKIKQKTELMDYLSILSGEYIIL
jgi:esterase/lipase